MNNKDYYESIFLTDRDLLWENAPGKQVVINALEFMLMNGDITKHSKVIDIGCGSGFLLGRIQKEILGNEFSLNGVDISMNAIQKAGKHEGISFFCEDGAKTHFNDNEFDVLISYGTLEHFPDPEAGINEASRILRKKGVFLCMIPSLGIDRDDRSDEGWYEERLVNDGQVQQMQWNLFRDTWTAYFNNCGLILFDDTFSQKFGALKPGVFFFGRK
jgi:SAM-dependent methyltransferase